MSVLTILLIIMVAWIIYHFVMATSSQKNTKVDTLRKLGYGKSIGLFAMITGIFGQLIGIYQAFSAIQQAGDISPKLVYGGIKVSMITTLYGIFIYLFSLLLWFVTSNVVEKKLG